MIVRDDSENSLNDGEGSDDEGNDTTSDTASEADLTPRHGFVLSNLLPDLADSGGEVRVVEGDKLVELAHRGKLQLLVLDH